MRLRVCSVALAWLAVQLFPHLSMPSYAVAGVRAGIFCSADALEHSHSQKYPACDTTACSSCACASLSPLDERERGFEPAVASLSWRRVDEAAPKAFEKLIFRARGPPPIV